MSCNIFIVVMASFTKLLRSYFKKAPSKIIEHHELTPVAI